MRFPSTGVRPRHGLISLISPLLIAGAIAFATIGVAAPAASAAFGVQTWEAGTCKESSCNIEGKDPTAEFFTQAAGHPNYGITNFSFNYKEVGALVKAKEPEGKVKDVRVDLPPGLAVDPEAVEQCSEELIVKLECPAASQVGEDEAIGTAELTLGIKTTVTESFPVFNVQRQPGEPARFGVEVKSSTLALAESVTGHKLQSVIYLEGGISWYDEPAISENSGVQNSDFHEFFKIQNIAQEPEIVKSKLIFWGVPHEQNPAAADNTFLTMPSSADACAKPQTTWLHVASYENPTSFLAYTSETRLENGTPLTATGCGALAFDPSLALKSETGQSDAPDGATVELHIPQSTGEPSKPNSPDVQTAEVTMPEGMTLNPSAAHGLQACTNAQIAIGSNQPVACPTASKIGTVTIDAPGIPNGSLNGGVYVGTQESQNPESGKEYRIFLAAEAPGYGVGVRLEGRVYAKEGSGQLRAVFNDNPQVPFESVILNFNGGPRAPLANPLSCGPATPSASITPYSGEPAKAAKSSGFTVGSGTSAPCASPLPFALTQSTTNTTPKAGAFTSFTLNLTRGDGQQYLSKVRTVLPAGLLGAIPSVPLCGAAQASAGTCTTTSEIGKVTATAGSGSEPYSFTGHVYLTGPFEGAPYGLSIVVPAVAGPFDLGNVVTQAALGVEQYSGRVVVTAAIPQSKGGVPLRLRTLSVAINRPSFLFNPTNCSTLASESGLTSASSATQALSTPFQVTECSKLPFKPSLSAATGAKTSRENGASLEVKITQGKGEANLHEVQVQLPKRLPSRVTTLRKACLAATFEAGPAPGGCTDASKVGTATVATPVLPGTLTGPAYLVSHGGEAFPDLDLILRGDGVQVVLVGHTHISTTGITTSTFETLPDVPISSAAIDLPVGPQSVLSANGSLCNSKLTAPTTLIAQSGTKLTQQTTIAVRNCPFAIVSHRTVKTRAILKVRVPAAGRITVSGHDLRVLRRRVGKATTVRLTVHLTRSGVRSLRAHKHLRIKLRVTFAPHSGRHLSASAKVKFHS
ncbi:MAG TPA: hypothetical protein VGL37_05470 [Solirubrobacteraceae bacterium]|jgi:hypothetical protein